MNPRTRFFVTALLLAILGSALALLALTLLDHRLTLPAVQRFDDGLQQELHAEASPNLTRVMLALTWIGAIKIFASSLFVVLVVLLVRLRRHAAAVLSGSITGAFALNESLKLHFHRARPHVPWALGDEHTYSFPSGHSLFSVALYGTLAYLALRSATSLRRRLAIVIPAFLLPLAIGMSRIYLGMHYPTDVAAGFLTGAIWLWVVILVDRSWHSTRHRPRPRPSPIDGVTPLAEPPHRSVMP